MKKKTPKTEDNPRSSIYEELYLKAKAEWEIQVEIAKREADKAESLKFEMDSLLPIIQKQNPKFDVNAKLVTIPEIIVPEIEGRAKDGERRDQLLAVLGEDNELGSGVLGELLPDYGNENIRSYLSQLFFGGHLWRRKVYISDKQWKYTYATPAYYKKNGITDAEVTTRKPAEKKPRKNAKQPKSK